MTIYGWLTHLLWTLVWILAVALSVSWLAGLGARLIPGAGWLR